MGYRGPAPKPTAVRLAEGNPGRRPLPEHEPEVEVLTPAEVRRLAPRTLSPRARYWWRRYGSAMCSMRTISRSDLTLLEELSRTTADREEIEAQAARTGPIYRVRGSSGIYRVNPLQRILMDLRRHELLLLREAGFTPAARSRVAAAPAGGSRSLAEELALILAAPDGDHHDAD